MTHDELKQVMDEADCIADLLMVERAIDAIARRITRDLGNSVPVVLCVVNGGIVFTGHLLTRLRFPLELDYIHATRYENGTQGRELSWIHTPTIALEGRHVLVLDDILDVGETLEAIAGWCRARGAASVRTAVLADKRHDRKTRAGLCADYTGLEIPDRYVFGFGMDYRGHWRNAPGIFAVRGL